MVDLSFREKSLLGSLVALVVISGLYFGRLLGMLLDGGEPAADALAGLGIRLLIALIVLEIIYQSVIAAFSPEEAAEGSDERDRAIVARAGNRAGVVLVVLMVGLVFHILGNTWFDRPELISPIILAHLVLFSLVVYQVVDYLSQLIAYRRGR